eukprot:gene6333-10340_t
MNEELTWLVFLIILTGCRYTSSEIYRILNHPVPDFSDRNPLISLAGTLFAMPYNINIGLNIKGDSRYALQLPLSNKISYALIWKFSNHALALFKDYFKNFPKIISCIQNGKMVPPEYSDSNENVNEFVQNIPETEIEKAIIWKEKYLVKKVMTKNENNKIEKKQEEKKVENDNILESRKKKKKLTKLKKVILIEKGKLEPDEVIKEEEEGEKEEEKERVETMNERQLEIELNNFINQQEESLLLEEKKNISGVKKIVREYVNQLLSPELDETVIELLKKLTKFQTKLKNTQPLKYKSKKRYVIGLREVERAIKSKRIRSIIIAPNIDKIVSPGGLDEVVIDLLNLAYENRVGVVFALNIRKMGKSIGKTIKISVIGIISAEGAIDDFRKMLRLSQELKEAWNSKKIEALVPNEEELVVKN